MRNKIYAFVLFLVIFSQIGVYGIHDTVFAQSEIKVPDWIRQLAKFWSEGDISDKEFASAIEYLVQSKIITSSRIAIIEDDENIEEAIQREVRIPEWIRNNAEWFSKDIINDSDFVLGIEYMIENQIIESPRIQIIKISAEQDTESEINEHETIHVDSDNDGILDDVDDCPDQAETINGFEDSDGCPDTVPILDSDNDGILDDVDDCPDQAETINGFEDSDGCPDTVPPPDKSLTISGIDIEWKNSGWGDQHINLSWTYSVEHIDENNVGFPDKGHFVIEISGIENVISKAEYIGENKFAGEYIGIDPGVGGGKVTLTVVSFIQDDRGNYVGDGDQKEIIIPSSTS